MTSTTTSPANILLVDDDPAVLHSMGKLLRRSGYRTASAADAIRARDLMDVEPFDAVVTDLNLFTSDGRCFAAALAQESRHPVIVVTGTSALGDVMQMLEGRVPRGLLAKPFHGDQLVGVLAGVLHGVSAPLDDDPVVTAELAQGMARALALRDVETEAHAQRVSLWTSLVARKIRMDEPARFWARIGALLHDIGKIGVGDGILKKPGPLDENEWAIMRRHPELGAELLAPITRLAGARDVVLHHHESWNGEGYPHGLAGEAIPLAARVFAPIDAYDAMTSDRPYRRGMSHADAMRRLVAGRGRQFDPGIIDVIVAIDEHEWLSVRGEVASGVTAATETFDEAGAAAAAAGLV